jgi:hypothetical protein
MSTLTVSVMPTKKLAAGFGSRLALGAGRALQRPGTVALVGAGLGAAKGMLSPGYEYDENGTPHEKSRLTGALGGAMTGGLIGAGVGYGGRALATRGFLGSGMQRASTGRTDAMLTSRRNAGLPVHNAEVMSPGAPMPSNLRSVPAKISVASVQIMPPPRAMPAMPFRHGTSQQKTLTFVNGVTHQADHILPVHHPEHGMGYEVHNGAERNFVPHDMVAKIAQLKLAYNHFYVVADQSGKGFIGMYKGVSKHASADGAPRASFDLHAPGCQPIEIAFDMRKLAGIAPLITTDGKHVTERAQIAHTKVGQKLANDLMAQQMAQAPAVEPTGGAPGAVDPMAAAAPAAPAGGQIDPAILQAIIQQGLLEGNPLAEQLAAAMQQSAAPAGGSAPAAGGQPAAGESEEGDEKSEKKPPFGGKGEKSEKGEDDEKSEKSEKSEKGEDDEKDEKNGPPEKDAAAACRKSAPMKMPAMKAKKSAK